VNGEPGAISSSGDFLEVVRESFEHSGSQRTRFILEPDRRFFLEYLVVDFGHRRSGKGKGCDTTKSMQ
jgi:hypothetical protein